MASKAYGRICLQEVLPSIPQGLASEQWNHLLLDMFRTCHKSGHREMLREQTQSTWDRLQFENRSDA